MELFYLILSYSNDFREIFLFLFESMKGENNEQELDLFQSRKNSSAHTLTCKLD